MQAAAVPPVLDNPLFESENPRLVAARWIACKRRALLLLLALTAAFRLITHEGAELQGHDEQVYGLYVRTFGEQGIAGLRALLAEARESPENFMGPLPFRIGYIAVGWLSCKLFGDYMLENLAWVSCAAGIGSVVVGFLLMRRWLSPSLAFLTALLMITAPLDVGLSRRALQDSFMGLVVLLSLLLYDQYWRRQKLTDLLVFGAVVLLGLLTKETMLLLYPCFALMVIPYHQVLGTRRLFPLALVMIGALVVDFFVTAWLAGGLDLAFQTYISHRISPELDAYGLTYDIGPWFAYLILFLLLAPVAYVLSIIGAVSEPPSEQDRPGRNLCIWYVLVCLMLFTLLVQINVRFVIFLSLPLRALTVLGIMALMRKMETDWLRRPFTIGLVLAVMLTDVYQFYQIFVVTNVYDPFAMNLILANEFWR